MVRKIIFPDIDKVWDFVDEIKTLPSDVDARIANNRTVVDAKSTLGLLSLGTLEILFRIDSKDDEEINKFEEICKGYD